MNKGKNKIKEYKLIGKSLYFPEKSVLVLADLHLGYEEHLNEQGVLVPRVQLKEIMKDLKEIFKKIKYVEKIIILGDLKHEFGTISSQEWKDVKEILDFLKKKARKILLIKGNHDTILEPLAKRKELKVVDYFKEEGICFLHGNKFVPNFLKETRILVLGHRHPAVILSDGYKKEKYKCFLIGTWRKKEVVILPSFFPFVEGSDVINCKENELFISEKSLRNFEAYVIGKSVYRFGKLKNMKKI